MAKSPLVTQEIQALGINPHYFEVFYARLNTPKQPPPPGLLPEDQYGLILKYLQDKKVLGEDGKPDLQGKGWKVFQARRTLEEKLARDSLKHELLTRHWEDGFDPEEGERDNCDYWEDGFDPDA